MKTAEEIIAYLEAQMKKSYEANEKYYATDASIAFTHMIRATTIQQLIDEIKEGMK